MKDRSTIVLIAACLIFPAMALLSADAMFGASSADRCMGVACRVVHFIRDYQTLIAAGLAVGAAWYAGKPVWLQLQNMHAQHDIMAREVIVKRLAGIQERTKIANEKSTALVHHAWEAMYGYSSDEDYDPASIDPEWADNAERESRDLVSTLRKAQFAKADTGAIESARARLISRTKDLADCLDSINAPFRWAGDPDMTDERERGLNTSAEKARVELPAIVDTVDAAKKDFASIARLEIESIKQRIREIDDSILSKPGRE